MYADDELVLIHISLSDNDLGSSVDDELVDSIEEAICHELERHGGTTTSSAEDGLGSSCTALTETQSAITLPLLLNRELPPSAFLLQCHARRRGGQVIRLHTVDIE